MEQLAEKYIGLKGESVTAGYIGQLESGAALFGNSAKRRFAILFTEILGRRIMASDFSRPRLFKIPLIAYISAGTPFQWSNGGFQMGDGIELLDLPPGMTLEDAESVYAVRIQGDSMFPPFKDGVTLYVKNGSWEEIGHGDYVIFKDRDHKAWVKMIFFREDKIILRSLNPEFEDIVLTKDELTMLERVKHADF